MLNYSCFTSYMYHKLTNYHKSVSINFEQVKLRSHVHYTNNNIVLIKWSTNFSNFKLLSLNSLNQLRADLMYTYLQRLHSLTHQVESSAVVVLLEELVFPLDLLVGDDLGLVPEVSSALLLCHAVHFLNFFSLLLLPESVKALTGVVMPKKNCI